MLHFSQIYCKISSFFHNTHPFYSSINIPTLLLLISAAPSGHHSYYTLLNYALQSKVLTQQAVKENRDEEPHFPLCMQVVFL